MRVLVTGATGFVGRSLCPELARQGHFVRAALRSEGPPVPGAAEQVVAGNVGPDTNWLAALEGIEAIVHCAARAHVLNDAPENASLYVTTNAHATRRLATEAQRAGVRRLIFLSSVKVNGERSSGRPFTAEDRPAPADDYGKSKWLGEQTLWETTVGSSLQAVVVRPPLIYGPGVRANFLRLMQWVETGWPLPLGAIVNRRSLVSVWNLCDAIGHLLTTASAVGRTWMVSDGEDLSTPQLIRLIAHAMGRPARLLPVSPSLLRLGGSIVGRKPEIERLCESLAVDISPLRRELGWAAPISVKVGIARTVESYLTEKKTARAR